MANPNHSILEGPWGDYTFHVVRPQDYDKVIQHIKDNFLHDEPMSNLIGYTEEYGEEFAYFARKAFKDNLSFWAEHNETGDVAAVRGTFRHTIDYCFDDVKMNARPTYLLFNKFVGLCNARCDLFEHYECDQFADFLLASCAPKYRRQGIVTEMYKRSLKFLAAEGFKMAKSIFNSPYSRAAARNLGFEEVARVYFHELRDDAGRRVFDKNKLNEEHYGSVLCKRL